MKPKYLAIAETFIGLKEVPGKLHNKIILSWWVKMKAWFTDDETPWCGLYIAICLSAAELPYPKAYYRALEWLKYGEGCPLSYGAIAVMKRAGGGHVAFVAGRTSANLIILLGGNQGNQVKYIAVRLKDIVGFRKPTGMLLDMNVPVFKTTDFGKDFA